MLWTSLALDIGALLLLLICAALYTRRGFLSGLFSFFGTLAVMVGAFFLARHLAPLVFERFLRPGLEAKAAEAIAGQQPADIRRLLEAALGFLPAELIGGLAAAISGAADSAAPGAAAVVVREAVAPLVIPILTAVLFLLLFLAGRLLVALLCRLARGLNRVPLVGTVNRALGAVMGIALGALYVFAALFVLHAADVLNPGQPFGQRFFASSFLYGLTVPIFGGL